MESRLLTLCLAVALLGACHACDTGKEFITTFLPNYQKERGKEHDLNVVLTAQGSVANVSIQVDSTEFFQQLTLSAGETRWISLPSGSELEHQFVTENSAVRISSSADISVVSFNQRHASGDGTVVSPTQELGTDYFVYTPKGGSKYMDSLLAIVNDKSPNRITIVPGASVSLRGGSKWKRGKPVTVTLEPYASYLVRSHKSLTGTRVQSQWPVAVLGGHQCLALGARCEHVYEQLPPVASLGKEYLVPAASSSKATSWAAIVAVEEDTKLTLKKGKKTNKKKLKKAGDVTMQKLIKKQPMIIKSDKRVMVLLLSNNKPSDPLLITLTPTSSLASEWAVDTVEGIPSVIAILSEREGAASVKVCRNGHGCLPSVNWKPFQSDKQWVWSHVAVGSNKSHVTVGGDADMAVYVFGGRHRHGYGTPGVCSRGAPPPEGPTDPCEELICRQQEHCENGKCVHVSTATCSIMGDPHYITFDGRKYDFQGSCTYTVATVAKMAADLHPFTVTTKNSHRSSRRVAYVRSVTVTVHNQTIVIDGHRGKVQVNGEFEDLPVRLLDGKINIKKSESYASLTTDFGLTVKYDWNMRLLITVTSSYYDHMGGLCGNYNGDRRDDLPVPKGRHLSAVLKMVQPWKLKDSDLFCHDNCSGGCPQCPIRKQEHYRRPNFCGLLINPKGPFAACHKKVQPTAYLDNCITDVCINKGARQFLCDNLKSYADACLSAEAQVNPEWRMISHCPLPCPADSHYEVCGSACPATCTAPHSEDTCTEPCVEGCHCDEGTVLSGERCEPESSCGCQYQDVYHEADTPFWGDHTCTTRCKCKNGKAKCKSASCKKSEHCALKEGVRDCYPLSYATCRGTGDPHYTSFDGRRFDFQGTCHYVLSQVTEDSDKDLVPFKVLVQNENRGSKKSVSFTKSVSLSVYGNLTISMSRSSPGKILFNGRSVNLPYSYGDGVISVFRHGYFGTVKTHFGLTLKFNWNGHVSLTLPSSYGASTEGLCGNYNGDAGDDLLKPDGSPAKHISDFGLSWKAGGDFGCTSDCPDGKCPGCEPAMLLRYQQGRYCGIIADKSGAFRDCHSKLDHVPFLTDCVFDLCMYQGHASILCDSLSAFSTACQEAGAKVESWRTAEFCPAPCGANSHYEVCALPCQLTCSELAPPQGCDESAPCTEDCVCDDGFTMSHDQCVPLAECGCQYQGDYYQSRQVFYPGEDCSTRCVCSDGAEIQCNTSSSCPSHEDCVVTEDGPSCSHRQAGSCSVTGQRTLRPFDGQEYPLLGDCVFTLVEVEEKEEGQLAAFSVFLRQQTSDQGKVLRSVYINVYDLEISMETGVTWEIKVDDISVSLPVTLADGKVRVNQNGVHILLETDFDLKLTYDTVGGVFIRIPAAYHSTPRGLCGNYNGKPTDDQASANDKPEDIAAVWVVEKEDNPCDTSCGELSCPEPDESKFPEALTVCGIITDQYGPLTGCHTDVPPTPYYRACVREMSTHEASADVLCAHIQSYVSTCQLSGVKIEPWRSNSFCPVVCPADSHYELCPNTCSSSCWSLQSPQPCPVCQEGCQCEPGLVSDGAHCVPVESCGCVLDGQYHMAGVSVLTNDCTEHCVCQSGQFTCNSTGCEEWEECRNTNGTLACQTTDPCFEAECRVKEHCEVTDGEAACVPDGTASCWAFGDPHYSTFDGRTYSFQGTCSYVLVNTTGLDPSLPEVTVTTMNEFRERSAGSFVRSSIVEMLGHRISIQREDRGYVTVDGVKTGLPVLLEEGSISITESGLRGLLQSDIGVDVTFDWSTLVMVTISSSYYGNVAGLCGDYNGNPDDDLPVGGARSRSWAESWTVRDDQPLCYHDCEGEACPHCQQADRTKFSGPEYCGILSEKNGPFAGCHGSRPVSQYVSDCVYDVCSSKEQRQVLCEALSSYLATCQKAGATVAPWRKLANCPPACPANSHYQVCGSACPPGCGPQPELCTKQCVEGCFCDQGYVHSGKECIVKEKACACNHEGHYHRAGEEFWADAQCQSRCVCDADKHKMKCKKSKGCEAGQTCRAEKNTSTFRCL